MGLQDPKVKADLVQRLRRIEGQTRGVVRMIEEDRDCQEILLQLAAIRAAVYKTSLQLTRSFAFQCFQDESPEAAVDALIQAISRSL